MLIARVSAISLAFSASTEVKNHAGIFTALECVERSLLGVYISDPVLCHPSLGSNLVSAQRCSMVDNQRLAIVIDNP